MQLYISILTADILMADIQSADPTTCAFAVKCATMVGACFIAAVLVAHQYRRVAQTAWYAVYTTSWA